jgi:hypothetical protein
MKHATEFLWIQTELSAKPADNSANSAGFCIFEIFMFLVCLNYISADFFWILLIFFKFSKNRRVARIQFLSSHWIC